jgi:diguanylate cyclase (GGDEF)-like protein/PAS domain S-box-containing protein
MFRSALSGIFIHDLDGNIIDVNPAAEKIHNATKEEILKFNVNDLYLKNDQHIASKNFETLMENGYVHVKAPLQTVKGKEFYAEIYSSLVEIGGKKLAQGTINDITNTYNSDKKMRQHEAISNSTKEGICITNPLVEIEYVNESFTTITGYSLDEIKGKNPSVLKSGRHDKAFYKKMWKDIDNEGFWQGEIWNRKKSGQIYPEYITIRKIKDPIGRVEGYVAVFSDQTTKKTDQRKIDFLNTHDPLTKLPNRQNIKDKLDHLIKNSNLEKNCILVISLDIDNFKNINDSFGHNIGDKLLIALTKRVHSLENFRTTIGRLSADEFVLFQKLDSFEQCEFKLQSLLDELQKPFEIDDKQINITISMGASIAPDDGKSAEILIKNADTAMHKVKLEGKSGYTFFKDEMTKRSYERILMINALKLAVETEGFNLYYQPLQNLDTKKIIGFEALIRWKSQDFGMVPPDKFIPLAEETKLILPIGEWVIKEACRQLSLWKNSGFFISINISGIQLYHSDILSILKKNIELFKIDASRLKLEITESTMMNLTKEISDTLDRVKKMGISLSIDDFGVGYSSLSRLKKLPVDALKIDKSFTIDIPQNNDACILSKSILSIAKQMGLHVIVEGIETKEQKEFYKNEKGCILQGYYLAKPMPTDELGKWLQESQGIHLAE